MRIIDTHLHLVDRVRFNYPWLGGVPILDRDWNLADYRLEADAAGIDAALHMEVDVADRDRDAETAWASALPAPVVGAIASCRPESEDFPAQIELVLRHGTVRGLRRILHTAPDDLALHPRFAENLRRLAPHELSFDLCVLARQLPIATALARACPDVPFILDHCGNPEIHKGPLDAWRADIETLAFCPNVMCKVSGLVIHANPNGWSAEDLRPAIEHVMSVFGWDRVVWGSDWPVCTLNGDLTRWIEATKTLLRGTSMAEQAKLLHGNARRIYRLA